MTKLVLGDKYTEKVKFTQSDVDLFAQVTGDNNPIHIDPVYAAKTSFGKPIVHGFYAGSVFSKVFGTSWPGEGTIYLYQEMAFRAPVFVDKEYLASFEIIEVDNEKHRAVVRCQLEDCDGKVAITGNAKLLHPEKF
jgi:acyl dehydratase